MEKVTCNGCGSKLKPYWIKDGKCSACRGNVVVEAAPVEMPETVGCVMKRLVAGGMTRFNSEVFYKEAMNALDLDFYSFEEIKAEFRKQLQRAGK